MLAPAMKTTRALCLPAALGLLALAVAAPAAPAPRPPRAAAVAGRVESFVLFDSTYQRPRRLWVYTPPGYDAKRATPYPLIVAFDGAAYVEELPLPHVLDSLLAAGRAPAFVAVLVDDSTGAARLADLANAPRMVELLARQIVPWVRGRRHVTSDPARTIVTGSSAGGLAAGFVAFSRPDLFGNVWSQSGAFWRGADSSNGAPWEWLTHGIQTAPRRPVRFVLEVGSRETIRTLGGAGPVFIEAHRRFRDALAAKGYEVTCTEIPGGVHSPEVWRTRLAGGIVTLAAGWPRP